jgi:hypothetical protein
MRFLKALVLPAFLFLLVTAESTPTPTTSPTPTPSPIPPPSPIPTPTPTGAYLSLDVSAGGANQVINVSGSSFLPNEQMSLYWDTPSKVIGSATADGSGNFANVKVKPFAGDPPGLHKICASVPPNPCAQFELQGVPTPTPSPPPSPLESPSPAESPSATASAARTPSVAPLPADSNGPNNLDVLLHPPFIFLPFIAALGLIGAIAYWALGTYSRRPRPALPSAAIVHRSARPEAGVPGIEVPPPAPPADEPQPPWPAPRPPIEDDTPDSPEPGTNSGPAIG